MKKSWGLIPKILSGEKTIESRWYQARRSPWGKVTKGDTIYFKNSGEPVTARAKVVQVYQFELRGLHDAERIVKTYGREICLVHPDPGAWGKVPRYAVLLRLGQPKKVAPFGIDKRGFGSAAAWLTVPDISKIKKPNR